MLLFPGKCNAPDRLYVVRGGTSPHPCCPVRLEPHEGHVGGHLAKAAQLQGVPHPQREGGGPVHVEEGLHAVGAEPGGAQFLGKLLSEVVFKNITV